VDQKVKQIEYILITSMNFPNGGAGATYLNLFCRGLKLSDCNIRVLLLKGHAFGNFTYYGPRNNITEEGIPFTYLGFKQRPVNKFLKICDELISLCRLTVFMFSLIVKRKKIKLLLYNSDLFYNIPIHAMSKVFGIELIKFVAEYIDKSEFGRSIFGWFKRAGYFLNFKYLNRLSEKLIVFSIYLKDEYIRMGYDENNIIVQPNLTDFDFWESGNGLVKYTLGYSGAPYLKDGLSDLFRAIKILKNKNVFVSLLIIGDATFGDSLIPMLKGECEKLGISENVFFTGLVESSQVKQHINECKILTITRPSTVQTKAGFPTKLGEYFATKKPVLATNFGDMDKYFTDGIDIMMAECENPESIAQKISWMLQKCNELSIISKKGWDKARQLLEYKSSVTRIVELLNSSN
jgi:glycosyltransferase involved in cell wall biosynthesis